MNVLYALKSGLVLLSSLINIDIKQIPNSKHQEPNNISFIFKDKLYSDGIPANVEPNRFR